jgi:hypothetical protein
MCQIAFAEDDRLENATATGPLPARQYPGEEPRWVRMGRGTFPFSSFAAASAAYRATIERLGLGASEAPLCEVLDDAGNVVARVGYNGRIFAVGADGESDYATVLHETGGA